MTLGHGFCQEILFGIEDINNRVVGTNLLFSALPTALPNIKVLVFQARLEDR